MHREIVGVQNLFWTSKRKTMSKYTDDFILDDAPTIPQIFNQLGILVLDGSGSMSAITEGTITKADAVNLAVRELLTRFIASKNRKDFSMAVVTFDHEAIVHTPITRVADDNGDTIDDNADYNPTEKHGGGTDILKALKQAQSLAEQFLNNAPADGVPPSVIIVVMSDGISQSDPIPAANDIKKNENISICSTLFAEKGGANALAEKILRNIASSPAHYKTVYDAETLRKFFIASVSSGKI